MKGGILRNYKKIGLGKRQTPRAGDFYNKKGILICGNCGKEREWHGAWPGLGETWAACICDCDKAKSARNKEAEEFLQKQRLAQIRREYAFPFDEELKSITLSLDDGTNARVSAALQKYANNLATNLEKGQNLVLFGGVGTGKTFFAAAVLNAAIDKGYKCLFTSLFHEINELSNAADKNRYLQALKEYDFVAFDDFGTERETEYALEQIYQIINARYHAGKPIVITTNLGVNDFSTDDIAKQRIFSRIFGKCDVILCNGSDRRKSNK